MFAGPWTWLRQQHGREVVSVDEPGAYAGAAADAAVAFVPGAAVAVVTADCAPIVLVADNVACVAVVHAGWKGLVAGVVDATVAIMRARDAEGISAALGPCIHPECYEFGADDLAAIADALGVGVRGVTSQGTAALDLPAAVRASLERNDVRLVHDEDTCTAHTPGYWSHRARADKQRQATVAWLT
ncbi:MAG TPA: polyphenol oxidase family protein [Acidimicrobiales bacterium]|nr:polyphenol oxidase family protein [Acidimicrobiales bacterium]